MLSDSALSWIRSHCPDPRFLQDFSRHFDKAAEQKLNCFLVIGPKVTKDGKPRMMHCFCGNLFIFELTLDQIRTLNVVNGKVLWGMSKRSGQPEAIEQPTVTISDLEIEKADSLPSDEPIVAHISYDTNGVRIGPCVFRLDYEIGGGSVSCLGWCYVDAPLGLNGRVSCRFLPVKKPDAPPPFQEPLAMFLRLCKLPDPMTVEHRDPISNICGTVVSVMQPLSPPTR